MWLCVQDFYMLDLFLILMSYLMIMLDKLFNLDGNVPDMSQDTANVPLFPRTWGCAGQ
jgi:hypothetical protein